MQIAIIGGGAAGFFAAITCAEANKDCAVVIFERGKSVLEKVKISGGGRCNVTHACYDPKALVQHYPRGSKELLGAFMQFGPQQTVEWFEKRGVKLKTEADGRMFPVTDDAQTISDCLQRAAHQARVQVRTSTRVEKITRTEDSKKWQLWVQGESKPLDFHKVMIAAGSSAAVWEQLSELGHTIVEPVPSLFTFNIKDNRIKDLLGISVPEAKLRILGAKLETSGPLLITHWGLSGPAILRLSAWGARALHQMQYQFPLEVNWTGKFNLAEITAQLLDQKTGNPKKSIAANTQFGLPIRLWQRLTAAAGIDETMRWADVDKKRLQQLAAEIGAGAFKATGKSTFKEEFVTAGGVLLKEVNFKTFESRVLPGLFMAGEILDIDAITGGFNFQAAWTGGYLAGLAMAMAEIS